MTTKLLLYNGALTICGERLLHSSTGLTEDRKPRRMLDQVWDNGAVDDCLSSAQWKFAMRTLRIDYDPDVEPEFGLNRAFNKPDDWVLTSGVCSDEFFNTPILRYFDEAGFWYTDIDEIYVRYVSNHVNYGNDFSLWPAKYVNYVKAYLASEIIIGLTNDEKKRDSTIKWMERKLIDAMNKDAMSDPTKFPAPGFWSSSRYRGSNRDRGNRSGNLIG